MNHPTHEDLVAHLYGELPAEREVEVTTHLSECSDCQRVVTEWRSSMAELDAWQLPAQPPHQKREPEPIAIVPSFKWAIAACLAIGMGFLGGRFSAPVPDAAVLRAALAPELQRLTAAMDAKLAEDRRAVTEILQTMQSQRTEDYASLRRALETLAVNTEDELQTAQQQIVQLASFTEPAKP
jgi:anti-sigma factor RsiW